MAALVFVSLATQSAQAQTFTVLYTFTNANSGFTPNGDLVMDAAGNLYGTTSLGGGPVRKGTVFELTGSGTERVLYAFGKSANDGAQPVAGLVRDPAGNLYGTTFYGGTANDGTVFKLSGAGLTILHSFVGSPTDGARPTSRLVRDCCGNLYGTTQAGGSGFGTIFRIDKNGNETVLRSFSGGWDGEYPNCITAGAPGVFFGTTAGGAKNFGTVFKVDSTGKETVLYRFQGLPDGQYPAGCVAVDAAGNMYGVTRSGGTFNEGTIFKVDQDGTETVLRNLGYPDVAIPESGLILGTDGNLYGTSSAGGASDQGTVFMSDTSGNDTILHSFNPPTDGGTPTGTLLRDAAGNLYGTTTYGGNNSYGLGTVFKITP